VADAGQERSGDQSAVAVKDRADAGEPIVARDVLQS
jgi:hypothetical protein